MRHSEAGWRSSMGADPRQSIRTFAQRIPDTAAPPSTYPEIADTSVVHARSSGNAAPTTATHNTARLSFHHPTIRIALTRQSQTVRPQVTASSIVALGFGHVATSTSLAISTSTRPRSSANRIHGRGEQLVHGPRRCRHPVASIIALIAKNSGTAPSPIAMHRPARLRSRELTAIGTNEAQQRRPEHRQETPHGRHGLRAAAPIQRIVHQLEKHHRVEQENAPRAEPQVPHVSAVVGLIDPHAGRGGARPGGRTAPSRRAGRRR